MEEKSERREEQDAFLRFSLPPCSGDFLVCIEEAENDLKSCFFQAAEVLI